jgi:hypothetical protein
MLLISSSADARSVNRAVTSMPPGENDTRKRIEGQTEMLFPIEGEQSEPPKKKPPAVRSEQSISRLARY